MQRMKERKNVNLLSFLNYFALSIGHVGAPLPCNLIKLVDVPEKNYFASKGEGEVSNMISKEMFVCS